MCIKCAKCNDVLCYKSDILDMIDNNEYEDMIDGGYCFDIKCEQCSYVNNVFAEIETKVSFIEVD